MSLAETANLQPSAMYDMDPNAVDALEKCGHTLDPNVAAQYSPRKKVIRIGDPKPPETEHEKVVRILKGDFEKKFGMSYDRFVEIYNEILKNDPEKLI